MLTRLRRRQYPQRHRHTDRGHRPAGADRHATACARWHFHILNERALYGLPRKFNVAFDGAGIIPVLEDTNDIAFQAVEVKDGFGIEAGHLVSPRARRHYRPPRFARDTGFIVRPAEAVKVADAIVRVFIEQATAPTATRRG